MINSAVNLVLRYTEKLHIQTKNIHGLTKYVNALESLMYCWASSLQFACKTASFSGSD